MNNGKMIHNISQEFNNQLNSTGHFGTFSNNNTHFLNHNDNIYNNQARYNKMFFETNPNKITDFSNNNTSNFSLNNFKFNNEFENSNLSIEKIKLLPNYFLDIEEALKKSNNNVRELKETVKEKINSEKKLKSIIDQLKIEKDKFIKTIEELNRKINQYENDIKKYEVEKNKYENTIKTYENDLKVYQKNIKSYQNTNGILETEINSLGEDINDGVKIFQRQMEKIQEENFNLINLNKKLTDQNYNYINEIKKLKLKIKNHLQEKMNFLEVNNLNQKQKIVNNKLNDINNYNKMKIKSLSIENEKLKNIEKDYQYLSDNYKQLCDDNMVYKEKIKKNENLEKNIIELKEKYEKEKFDYLCQINIWKKNFLSIAKYKLLNYNPDNENNIMEIMKIEEKYINNAQDSIKKLPEKILDYFKKLINQDKINDKNKKDNNNEIKLQNENINIFNNKLNEEKKMRRDIFNKYLNLRGNISIMCRIRPLTNKDKKEILMDKNSKIDIYTFDKNSIIVKNFKVNNNLKKYEFDYVFSENKTQEDIYEEISPFVQLLFKGENIIITSLGQKNSGKTFTIFGDNNNIGIVSRAIKEIFYILNNVNKEEYNDYDISMNFISIYNEEVYNLLEESTPKMNIKENSKGEFLIEDLNSIKIKSYEEYDKLFELSKKYRDNFKNVKNENNIGHCIFSFVIKINDKEGNNIESNLIFIDLSNENEIKINEMINDNQDDKEDNKEDNKIINKDESIIFKDLYNFLLFLNKNNINDYKDMNKNMLVNYIKNYIKDNKYKFLLLLNINPDINEVEKNLKTLYFGEGIFSEINNK